MSHDTYQEKENTNTQARTQRKQTNPTDDERDAAYKLSL